MNFKQVLNNYRSCELMFVELSCLMINVQSMSIKTDFMLFHSYIDFRGKTLAQLNSEGFYQVVIGGSPTFSYGSNGIVVGGSFQNSYGGVYKKLPFALTNQHKIILRETGYGRGNNQAFLGLGSLATSNLQESNERDCEMAIPIGNRNNNEFLNLGVSKSVNGTRYRGIYELKRSIATGTTGEFSIEFEIDLKNQTAKRTVNSPSLIAGTMQGQLNSDGYNAILGMEYAHFRAGHYSDIKNQDIYTGEIIIRRA